MISRRGSGRGEAWLTTLSLTCSLAACSGAGGIPQSAAAPSGRPLTFAFEPGTTRYLSASHTLIDQEIQGQLQRSETSVRYRLTVDLLPADTGLSATFTIDTVLRGHGPSVAAEDLAHAVGRTFTADLARSGRLSDIRGVESVSPFLRQIINQISDFFPRLPRGGAAPGNTWVDTTEILTGSNGSDITIRAITRNSARDWGQHQEQLALPVNWTRTYTVTGAGEQLGQPFTLDGNGETQGQSFLSADGRYLGSVASDSRDIEILLTGVGMTIPLRQVRADTVRILPQ